MSYNVARRRGEIGIRMALGAEQSRVLRMVLREVALLIVIGLTVGLGAALATTRFVESFLYGIKSNDPLTLSLAAGVLALVAALAGYLPARRASRLDPMAALREE
jgi:ABC-type antimicrobial peptide transport system permease subunit